MADEKPIPMMPSAVQQMSMRYKGRIDNQIKIIERLQEQVVEAEKRHRELEDTVMQLTRDLAQAREDARVALKQVNVNASTLPQPAAPEAVWDRRVPEEERSGPTPSGSDEVIPFLPGVPGWVDGASEERPGRRW